MFGKELHDTNKYFASFKPWKLTAYFMQNFINHLNLEQWKGDQEWLNVVPQEKAKWCPIDFVIFTNQMKKWFGELIVKHNYCQVLLQSEQSTLWTSKQALLKDSIFLENTGTLQSGVLLMVGGQRGLFNIGDLQK